MLKKLSTFDRIIVILGLAFVLVVVVIGYQQDSDSDRDDPWHPHLRMTIEEVLPAKEPGAVVVVGVISKDEVRLREILMIEKKSG